MIRRAIGHYNMLSENRSEGEQAVYAEFGKRLQTRLMEMGWPQAELARRASAYLPTPAKGQVQGHSIGRDLISNYIRGKYLPRPPVLAALAKALKCKPADLLPPDFVPSVGHAPRLDATSLDGQRISVRLNRVMSTKAYTKLVALLAEDDKETKHR